MTEMTQISLNLFKRRKIMVCYDMSEACDSMIQWILDYLLVDQRDHVILLTVSSNYPAKFSLSESDVRASEAKRAYFLEATQDALVNLFLARDITSQKFVICGDASKIILDLSSRTNCNMIVLGSSQSSGLRRFFLRSVSSYVANSSSIPVLIYKDNYISSNQSISTDWRQIRCSLK